MSNAVFITGACKGTGYRIAEVFASNGWDVIITGRNGAEAEKSAKILSETYSVFAKGYECNIRNEQQIIDIFNDIDNAGVFVETVVLCAADLGFGTDPAKGMDFFSVPVEEFTRVFETNLVWNFTIVRQAALRMKEKVDPALLQQAVDALSPRFPGIIAGIRQGFFRHYAVSPGRPPRVRPDKEAFALMGRKERTQWQINDNSIRNWRQRQQWRSPAAIRAGLRS